MKKLRLITLVLLIAFFLNGCGFFLPYFFLNFSQADQTEVEEVLPIGKDIAPNLDAEDIYYRNKFAAGGKAFQYSLHATTQIEYEDDLIPMTWHSDVVLDPETVAVNLDVQLQLDYEEPELFHAYYRDEDGRLICYAHWENTGECTREEIPLDGMTTYWIIARHVVYGYPYAPQNLALDPQTRILNGREVYLLTFEQTALEAFGSTGNASQDAKLSKRNIPTTWYVDAETYLTVQQHFTLTRLDDLLGQIIADAYQVPLDGESSIAGFSFTLDNLVFDPVEVPPVPDDVMAKAWEAGGFSAN